MESAAQDKLNAGDPDTGGLALTGKHAIVTGAAGCIGRAAAIRLAEMGATLTLVDVESAGMAFIEDLPPGEHQAVIVDLGSKVEVDRFCAEHLPGKGADILVNSVGILNSEKCLDSDWAEWHQVMSVNVDSILLLSQAVLPTMKERGWGRLINLGSLAAKTGGITAGTAYSTSKAAVEGLTRSIAREFAPYGVTANVIAPAYVMSPMVSKQLSDDERSAVLTKIPVGRFCDPEEVAHAIMFLVDERAGFITGEVISVSGGLALG